MVAAAWGVGKAKLVGVFRERWLGLTLKENSQDQSVGPLIPFKEQNPRETFLICMRIFILFTQEPETQVQKATRPLENPLGLAQLLLQAQAELNQKSGSTQLDGQR